MTSITATAPSEQIVIDVTGWEADQRTGLLDVIDNYLDALANATVDATGEHGWTREALRQLTARLQAGRNHAQALALSAAVKHGGTVSRDEVYTLAGYESTRSLKGFTRPVNRITELMRTNGDISSDAIVPLAPIYDETVTGYQRTQGFRIPPAIVELWRTAE